jgi:IS5 family transposase
MFVEGDSFRDAVIRIDTSEFLRDFVGLGIQPTMDYSFLSKAHSALSEQTWQAMNAALAQYARREEKIDGEKLRLDSTVYESHIHYPTDSSLLWDAFRTLARVLKQLQRELPRLGLKHRFHSKKAKKLAYFIARNAGSPSRSKKRKVRSAYRKLIERVRWIAAVGREALRRAGRAGYEVEELKRFLPTVEKIVDQAQRRVLDGCPVTCEEKVYSLFEAHTELLKRGKAGKPVEFGHKVLIAQTGEKFIHHYEVLSRRREDIELLEPTLEAHRRLFEANPGVVATDKGFYESMKQMVRLERDITTVAICKKGRRNERETLRESTEAFQEGQRFRAGVEGSISVLKRAFKLGRCFFKGYKNYAASVGCAIFCHNLVLLTRL